ncbi:hypothetical protein MCAMS1_00453 [biofilm metagenome]
MKGYNPANNNQQNTPIQVDKRSAYHHAGHAAAIYLGNKQKQLPVVHFQMLIKEQGVINGEVASHVKGAKAKRIVKIEGGRLIQSLPLLKTDTMEDLSIFERQEYRLAYEADIVNILAGPLAEAKYVALRENKIFNPNLVYLGALKFYGGRAKLNLINEYLDCVLSYGEERDHKLAELFLSAYSFINNQLNWHSINALVAHILEYRKEILDCNEVIALLESSRLAA